MLITWNLESMETEIIRFLKQRNKLQKKNVGTAKNAAISYRVAIDIVFFCVVMEKSAW